jgi:hypothetical protein
VERGMLISQSRDFRVDLSLVFLRQETVTFPWF